MVPRHGSLSLVRKFRRVFHLYTAWISRLTQQHYRRLSEAEWEYAPRAGSTSSYWWGNEIRQNNANCKACGSAWDNEQAAPAGSSKRTIRLAGHPWQCPGMDRGLPDFHWSTCQRVEVVRSLERFPCGPRVGARAGVSGARTGGRHSDYRNVDRPLWLG
jgi:hypothetical protein